MTSKEFALQVFPNDFCVQRKYVPWMVFSCCLALTGSMLFGLFFGKNEAQNVHIKERAEIVQKFAVIMSEKDTQIDKLTGVLIATQRLHVEKLTQMDETVRQVATFLGKQGKVVGMAPADIERLESHVKKLQQQVLDVQVEQQRIGAKR